MSKAKWTSNDIPDLTGKVIIVTGGNSGLGYESVKAFAENGADVIMGTRDIEKGNEARRNIGETRGTIVVMQLDLTSLDSIKSFANTFISGYKKLGL